MYKFFDNIRVKTCDDLSFLVNISDNTFFVIKTNTLKFLELKIQEGLTIDKFSTFESDFVGFIRELEKQKILEAATDEI